MSVNYIEKGIGLWKAIDAARLRLIGINGVYFTNPDNLNDTTNDAAVQAIINAYDNLPDYKADAVKGIKANGLARIQVIFPAITDLDLLKLVTQIMASILPAAKSLTADMTKAGQIYTAASNGITAVNAAANKAAVDAAVAAINWPA